METSDTDGGTKSTAVGRIIDRPLGVHRWVATPDLMAVVELLASEIEAGETRRKRSPDDAEQFRAAILVLILKLMTVRSISRTARLAVSLSSNTYSGASRYRNPNLTYRPFDAAYEGLLAGGYLRVARAPYHDREGGESYVTRIVVTDKLAGLMAERALLRPFDIGPSPTRETME